MSNTSAVMAGILEWVWDAALITMLSIAVVVSGFVVLLGALWMICTLAGFDTGPIMKERVEACNQQGGIYTEYGCQVLRK
jgi:hypothetical protein